MTGVSIINRVAIGDIIRRSARRFPDKIALVDENNETLTFKQFEDKCNQFANYLLDAGFKKGDSVVTICSNSIDFAVAIYGIAKAGLVWVPINPAISLSEKLYVLEKCEAKLILSDAEFLGGIVDELKEVCGSILTIGNENQVNTKSYSAAFKGQSSREPEVDINERDVAQIMFTSGTTGNPKGVMISHLAVYMASLNNIIEAEIREDDVGSVMMPMFHCAQHTLMTAMLNISAKVVIIKKFEPESFMDTTEKNRISWVFALPMMFAAIINHPDRNKYDLGSLRYCMYAMAPMPKTLLEKGIKELNCRFSLGSGQTEMYPATVIFKPEYQMRKTGPYWGQPSLITDLEIMDEQGNLLPHGEVGEIVHRGPNVMSGYLKDTEATLESRKYGWHHTGDLGYIDQDGLLVFVERKKDMIKTGGENVASIQVEHTIIAHEKVENVSVVGLPHSHWTEAVTAFVKPKAGVELSETEIIHYCKKHLGSFQVPKAVIFIEDFPMTTTGKIQKNILRKQYNDYYQEQTISKGVES